MRTRNSVSFTELRRFFSHPIEALSDLAYKLAVQGWLEGIYPDHRIKKLNASQRRNFFVFLGRSAEDIEKRERIINFIKEERNNDVFTFAIYELLFRASRSFSNPDEEFIQELRELAESRYETPQGFIENIVLLTSINATPNVINAADCRLSKDSEENYFKAYPYSEQVIENLVENMQRTNLSTERALKMLKKYLRKCSRIRFQDIVMIEETISSLDLDKFYNETVSQVGFALSEILKFPENSDTVRELYKEENEGHLLASGLYDSSTRFEMGKKILENNEISNAIAERILIDMLNQELKASGSNLYGYYLQEQLEANPQPNGWGEIIFRAANFHKKSLSPIIVQNLFLQLASRTDLSQKSWLKLLHYGGKHCYPRAYKAEEEFGARLLKAIATEAPTADKIRAIIELAHIDKLGDPESRKGQFYINEYLRFFFFPAVEHFNLLPRTELLESLSTMKYWRSREESTRLANLLPQIFGSEPNLSAKEEAYVESLFVNVNYSLKFEENYWESLLDKFEHQSALLRNTMHRLSAALH